mmetsp:Transcript_35291/g.90729  ORF Transcript_35291/g.90729 Transcript_35291/m.90729 type:complete len:230 (+) Transcript_35291:1003-1692(+)
MSACAGFSLIPSPQEAHRQHGRIRVLLRFTFVARDCQPCCGHLTSSRVRSRLCCPRLKRTQRQRSSHSSASGEMSTSACRNPAMLTPPTSCVSMAAKISSASSSPTQSCSRAFRNSCGVRFLSREASMFRREKASCSERKRCSSCCRNFSSTSCRNLPGAFSGSPLPPTPSHSDSTRGEELALASPRPGSLAATWGTAVGDRGAGLWLPGVFVLIGRMRSRMPRTCEGS